MKETSLRRSLSERKIAKKDRKEKTRSAHLDNSLTPISIIGGEQQAETMNGYPESTGGTLDHSVRGSKKTKFWKLKVFSDLSPQSVLTPETKHLLVTLTPAFL